MCQTRMSPFPAFPGASLRWLPPAPRGRALLPLTFLGVATLGPGGIPPASATDLVINEVLYDAEGPDDGLEFVELLLTAGEPLDLGRVALERGNGSRPGDWREAWRGAAGETLAAGRHYVVGGPRVVPAPATEAELRLENGPDACRVLVDGMVADVVGWGTLEAGEFFAGQPGPDVTAGSSLGRVPDGHDTGNNRADFVSLPTPSPGSANRRPPTLRLRSPRHRSDAGVRPLLEVDWLLEAGAGAPVPPGLAVEVSACPCLAPDLRATRAAALADGKAEGALVLGPLDPGPLDLCLTWSAPGAPGETEPARGDTLRVAARAGPGPLRVNEFLYHPAPGEPEWVELINAGPDTVDAGRFALADARGAPAELTGARRLAPGELCLVVEAELADVPAAIVLGSRWPLLNDAGLPVADHIRVVDEAGRTSDDVAYSGDWAPVGISVERLGADLASSDPGAWTAAPFGATPLGENGSARKITGTSGFLRIEPIVARAPAPGPVLLELAERLRSGALTVHAMDGQLVRRFAGPALAGRRLIVWDGLDEAGEPLPPGLYLVSVAGEVVGSERTASAPGGPAGGSHTTAARATFVVAP